MIEQSAPAAGETAVASAKGSCGKKLKCPHCPFRFKSNDQGADFDDDFTVEHVDAWINSDPWPCHQDIDGKTPCSGQALFKAGKLDVTREELVDFWVNRNGYLA